jgi:hypothetical protein
VLEEEAASQVGEATDPGRQCCESVADASEEEEPVSMLVVEVYQKQTRQN